MKKLSVLIPTLLAFILLLVFAMFDRQPEPQDQVETTDIPPITDRLWISKDRSRHSRMICAKETHYNAQGEITKILEWEYDEDRNIILCKRYDAKGKLQYSTEEEYDRNGNIIRKVENNDSQSSQTLVEYNEKGNILRSIWYDTEGNATSTNVYEHNEDGNLTQAARYGSDGSKNESIQYEYDAKGNQTSCAYYDADGIKRYETKISYDNEGRCLSYTFCDTDGNILFKAEDEYDEKGNRVCSREYEGKNLVCQSKRIYDEKNNLIQYTRYGPEGEIDFTCKIEYDEYGNKLREEKYNQTDELVSKIEYEGHQTVCLTEL